jgi:energy-coupling factor transporter ATP-binding protein EcfA2
MDFFKIKTRMAKDKETGEKYVEIYPSFIVGRSKDLMVRGRSFYAIWDDAAQLWSTDEYDVPRLVDAALWAYRDENYPDVETRVLTMRDYGTDQWAKFRKYLWNLSDNDHPIDEKIIFSNQETTRSDYASMKLSYPLNKGGIDAWDQIIGTLYTEEERKKLEWAIGAIVHGDSRYIQKFIVLYGAPGTGKSTILNIIEALFEDYVATFDAKSLGNRNNQFATSMFASNPLVAIQHDGDLSRLEDNTIINTIVSHENITINEKNKPTYTSKINAFLFMGTNAPVKISDSRSGLIRRLIQVSPSGNLLPAKDYKRLMKQVVFEYGAIAQHCLEQYEKYGFNAYDNYRPTEMMYQTDDFLNFVTDNYDTFRSQEYTTVKQAYALYKEYCEEYGVRNPMPRNALMRELSSYFDQYHDRVRGGDGTRYRSCFSGFKMDNQFRPEEEEVKEESTWIELKEQKSIFDESYQEAPAQLTSSEGTPAQRWANVRTVLSDIDTSELHYVMVPENHIVIDFDLTDDDGTKSLQKNIAAASQLPATYSEVSKSGGGLHLHYIYDGDVTELARLYDEDIEIKVYTGASSLRRKLSLCTDDPIRHISSGLPLKEKNNVLAEKTIRSEKSLRKQIDRNLRKEIHPATTPSIQFIKKILDDAYADGLTYDVTDMKPVITTFASKSSNRAIDCLRMVKEMKFKSELEAEHPEEDHSRSIVFFDVEVYPNLFLICWKYQGVDTIVKMINPQPHEVEDLFRYNLVGFNNRRYDNHILYARFMGYDNEALYALSQRIISNDHTALFAEAYGLSYADIYDFSSKKQSLAKFQIELGISHVEMDIPWDQPVPDDQLMRVISYCENDVRSTEAVFESREGDYIARRVLSDLSGLPVNDPTRKHAETIIFGNDREPQKLFNYTNLATGEVV